MTRNSWNSNIPIGISQGGTNVTSVTTAPTATAFAGWDANSNLSAQGFIPGFTTTATAGGTTPLTVGSSELQFFTGSTTQTVTLPSTGIVAGQQFMIVNNSTGVVTVQSSGANTIQAMAAGTTLTVTALIATPTTAANWNANYANSSVSYPLSVANGGTGDTTLTAHAVLVGEGTSPVAQIGPGATGQILMGNTGADPSFSTASYPSTTSINQILYSSAANTVTGLATANNAILVTNGSGVPSFSASGLSVPQGGTGDTTLTAHAVLVGEGTSPVATVGPGSAGQILQSGGALADPAYSTATYSSTTTANQLLYSSATNTVSGLATANNAILITNGSGVPSFSASGLSVPLGGTGDTTLTAHAVLVGEGTSPVAQVGPGSTGQVLMGVTGADPIFSTAAYPSTTTVNQLLYSSSANTVTGLATANNAILVTNGSGVPSFSASGLTVPQGGTGNTTLTAHAVLVGEGTSAVAQVGPGTANQVLMSGGAGADPAYSTATYPPTTTANQLLYSSATNTIGGLTSANTAILITNGSGVPSFSTAPLGFAYGGTNVTSVTTTPTATSFAGWDANENLSANSFISGFTSTATAGGNTTLTVASTQLQFFTGATTQTVTLPTTGVVAGQQYTIVNKSTGSVTVQSSGANTIQVMSANTVLSATALVATPTTAANWNAQYAALAGSLSGYTTTATAGGTTTLTSASTQQQYFTGSSTQTVTMPVTSTLVLGQQFIIVNNSTGIVTVQSSGANTIQAMAANSTLTLTVVDTSVATAAAWNAWYSVSVPWDQYKNLTANSVVEGFTTTATAGGVTTLTIASTQQQYFTGATTQTVVLPTTSIVAGQQYTIVNNSTGTVTVNASGGANVQSMAASTILTVTALVATPTTAANWNAVYTPKLAGNTPTQNIQTFTSSGTYTPSANLQYAIVEVVGGGGGSGGTAACGVAQVSSGAGGGGGGYARGTFSATTIGSSQTVTIGAGGSAGASGGAGTGGTGGTTSIGSLLVASGGAGGAGQGAVSAGVSVAGTGGAGITGQLLISGSVGGVGVSSSMAYLGWGGAGGASMLSETNSSPVNGAAVAGQNYGGGASGASTYSNGGAQAGAPGAAGVCIITEYIFAPPPLTTTASITWNTVPGTSQSMSASNGYYTTNASATTLTLPTAAAAGTVIEVLGTGAGLWTIAQNASQQIQFGAQNTTVGTGGSIVSTQVGSDIKLVCTTANTTWFATSSIGNLIVN